MKKDEGSQGETQIWQCENTACNFRYPILVHAHLKHLPLKKERTSDLPDTPCPRCGAASRLVLIPVSTQVENPVIEPIIKTAIHPVEILLDNIRSTFNVGAMFRSSDGAGAKHIHLCGTTPTPEHPKVCKTALGAEHTVPWSYHPNAVMAALNIREQSPSYQLWALESCSRAENLFEVITMPLPDAPILLIVGNEVSGVDPELIEICNKIISIPMLGYKRSLNVAIAFGIAIYSLCVSASYISKNLSV